MIRFRPSAVAFAAAIAIGGAFFALPETDATPALERTLVQISPAAGTAPEMASHKALYSFKMAAMEQGSAITGIKGKMYFEQNDVCDAWTTDQRFTTEYQYPERRPVLNTSHYVAWEAKDQSMFHFSSERQQDGRMTEQLRGSVEKDAAGVAKAVYSRPDDLSIDLPKGYTLPTVHTVDVINHARKGDRFYNAVLFDGTDADGPVEVNVFIGKKATAAEIKKIASSSARIDTALLSPEAWHVRMAFFPLKDSETASPVYEMDLLLHDNGIVSYSLVDYKTFKVEQKLEAIEKVSDKACP